MSPKILIVEDDTSFGVMLQNWCKRNGYETVLSFNVEQAKKEILKNNFKIILTDLRLPDGDGIMLLAWIKEQKVASPVIIMTSYAEIQSAVSAMKLGAFDYLEKPINPTVLKNKIDQALSHTPQSTPIQTKPVSRQPGIVYGKSKGAISPSGWKADSMPYMVEFDNFGTNGHPGIANLNDHFCWGYDDITWFAIQNEEYRNHWLWYAFDWIRENDPNGHLQMCAIRMIQGEKAKETLRSYFANTNSIACPVGYSQEETIKEIWQTRLNTYK